MSPPPADVAIVGAGIIGLAAAAYLVEEGRSVVLIDRDEPATAGASRGNAGALAFSDILPLASPGIIRKAPGWLLDPLGPLAIPPAYLPRIAPWLLRFWRASWPDRVRESTDAQGRLMRLAETETQRFLDLTGTRDMIQPDGALELYESEAELAASEVGWQAKARHGIAFEHVRGARLAELQPGLDPRFVAGTFVPGWMNVADPYLYARRIADHALARGATFMKEPVRAVTPDGDGVAVVLESGETLAAGRAVIAAGAWSKPLAAALGDTVPLETERGYNTTLPTDAFDLRRQLTFGRHGFVISRMTTGIRVGGAVELGGLKLAPNFARSEAMLRKAKAFLPGLRTEDGRQWMGFRPSLPDSRPVIGPSRASPRIVYAFGHGHLGLTQSAATGRLVADLLGGRAPPIDLAPYRAGRF